MSAYTTKELKAILKLHQISGTRADLTRANLTGVDLTGVDPDKFVRQYETYKNITN